MKGFGVPNGHQNHEKTEKSWLEAHVCFVVDFSEVFYGSRDLRTTEIRCFVYTKHHFSEKAPIDFKLEFLSPKDMINIWKSVEKSGKAGSEIDVESNMFLYGFWRPNDPKRPPQIAP